MNYWSLIFALSWGLYSPAVENPANESDDETKQNQKCAALATTQPSLSDQDLVVALSFDYEAETGSSNPAHDTVNIEPFALFKSGEWVQATGREFVQLTNVYSPKPDDKYQLLLEVFASELDGRCTFAAKIDRAVPFYRLLASRPDRLSKPISEPDRRRFEKLAGKSPEKSKKLTLMATSRLADPKRTEYWFVDRSRSVPTVQLAREDGDRLEALLEWKPTGD